MRENASAPINMISSPDIDKYLRKYLCPILRESGFAKVGPRNAWGWHDSCVWVFNLRAVGSYFSDVTGWPPMSVGVWLGTFYDFIPFGEKIKTDDRNRLLPKEYQCQMRSHLSTTIDQSKYTSQLANPAERRRRDIWWIERDGSNVEAAVENIALSFVDQGKPWFYKYTDLNKAFSAIEGERDCYKKYYRAKYLAKQLGLGEKYKEYSELAEKERALMKSQLPWLDR